MLRIYYEFVLKHQYVLHLQDSSLVCFPSPVILTRLSLSLLSVSLPLSGSLSLPVSWSLGLSFSPSLPLSSCVLVSPSLHLSVTISWTPRKRYTSRAWSEAGSSTPPSTPRTINLISLASLPNPPNRQQRQQKRHRHRQRRSLHQLRPRVRDLYRAFPLVADRPRASEDRDGHGLASRLIV